MLNTPFEDWPKFSKEEADAVAAVLRSNRVNYLTGKKGREFENKFAKWCGAQYAVALSNGTVALELSLKALGIGPGDEVIVSPRTFVASISCIAAVGATPVFADVDRDSQNITAETIQPALSRKSRAIICVHLAGWPCEMDPILKLARKHKLKVIEDCAQAHGALYKGKPVGSLGHIAAWSFCQDKIMTTGGEGGMVTTNNKKLWSQIWSLKDHGKSWSAVYEKKHPPGNGFRWVVESFGTNGRLTEMQSAVGLIQLGRMKEWKQKRQDNVAQILEVCRKFSGLRVPEVPDHVDHAGYRAYVFARPENLKRGWSRDRIMEQINALGVPCYVGSCSEVYREKVFEKTGWRPRKPLPNAKELGETSLMFLVHPTLRKSDIVKTRKAIEKVLNEASK
ncbi:MAG: DegT/DnrJ/EryC1/StrS aminotransferase family protein [Candidatus Nitronauta litoralis]|uniref:DegT/DnrJ/EryC1/StrS aminotransferase family protein n=1 Tax=Candidatus Nitronauta litoralis TaxID=2705533 RepID=A0A7T0BUM0_9BACT|nr:MAG: DegT/DnrJ/EryC1/StrS aminotransferase family protein [Candidatus Nitronauta litoralis]